MEYAFGTDPNDDDSRPEIETFVVSDGGINYIAIRFPSRTGANDLEITGQISSDLSIWTTDMVSFGNPIPNNEASELITLRSTSPIPASTTQQIRLRVEISQ